jgi:hypothetical protein
MRRTISVVALCVMLIATIGTLGASASAQTFSASAGTAPAGGSLPVSATVHQATTGSTFSAVAVVHFATGDVTWDLQPDAIVTAKVGTTSTARDAERRHHQRHHHRRRHHHQQTGVDLTASALVPIPGEEPWGTVDIDVTITYGDQVVTVSTTGLVDGY